MGRATEDDRGRIIYNKEIIANFFYLKEREVALQSDGVKMTFASEQPHLLGVDEDRFSAGVVLYYLKVSCWHK